MKPVIWIVLQIVLLVLWYSFLPLLPWWLVFAPLWVILFSVVVTAVEMHAETSLTNIRRR